MDKSFPTCIDKVGRRDTVEVVDIGLQAAEESGGIVEGEVGDLYACLTDLDDVFVVGGVLFEGVRVGDS